MYYTEKEIDDYNEYMDWVREQIMDEEDRGNPKFIAKLIDIDEICIERDDQGRYYRHHWSLTYSDGQMSVGEIRTVTFENWRAVKLQQQRDNRLEEIGIK